MRIILYTGKGGVGKTTLSAATAVRSAAKGHRTVVMSIDTAHSLGDAFDTTLSEEPTTLAPNLDALEINVHHELEKNWSVISKYVKRFLASQGYDEIAAEELAVMPGMEELFSLLRLLEFEQSGRYDLAIIDSAPTGSTLQFLAFSDIIDWYMKRFFNLERRIIKAVKPIAEKIIKAPLPTDEVFVSIENIYTKIISIKELLTNPERSSVRIVTNPEKMVVAESRRAYIALSLFGFPVDCVIANRVIPAESKDDYLAKWRNIQKIYLKQIHEYFDPIPIKTSRLFHGEVFGQEKLGLLAMDIFGDDDPAQVLHFDRPFWIDNNNGTLEMNIKLPGVSKDKIDLWTKNDELIITVEGRRRNLLLPRALQGRRLSKARYNNDVFTISFEKED